MVQIKVIGELFEQVHCKPKWLLFGSILTGTQTDCMSLTEGFRRGWLAWMHIIDKDFLSTVYFQEFS